MSAAQKARTPRMKRSLLSLIMHMGQTGRMVTNPKMCNPFHAKRVTKWNHWAEICNPFALIS